MVNLQKPRLKVSVNQNIKAQDVKAQLVLEVVRLSGPIDLPQVWLRCYQRLDDQVVDAPAELLCLETTCL